MVSCSGLQCLFREKSNRKTNAIRLHTARSHVGFINRVTCFKSCGLESNHHRIQHLLEGFLFASPLVEASKANMSQSPPTCSNSTLIMHTLADGQTKSGVRLVDVTVPTADEDRELQKRSCCE